MKISSIVKKHPRELVAVLVFITGATLGLLGLVQIVPLLVGILGLAILSSGLIYFCLKYTSEKAYKEYYKESYEIEHETIEEVTLTSMRYHRYQEAVLARYESACRDLDLVDEQKYWLLDLLMAAKNKVDEQLDAEGGGHI